MKALLTALEEGRLIELPEADKQKALTLLASLIEAVPGVRADAQIVEGILAREAQANTYLAYGIACPHVRTADEGELLCAVGWSPQGILYGDKEGKPVPLVLLYYIPDSQRTAYLKEVSALARALQNHEKLRDLAPTADLNAVRMRLLDLVAAGMESAAGEARARMIHLEARGAAQAPHPSAEAVDPARLVPAWIVHSPDGRVLVLAQDGEVARLLEAQAGLGERLTREPLVRAGGCVIHVRQSSTFGLDRQLHDCLVITPEPPKP